MADSRRPIAVSQSFKMPHPNKAECGGCYLPSTFLGPDTNASGWHTLNLAESVDVKNFHSEPTSPCVDSEVTTLLGLLTLAS